MLFCFVFPLKVRVWYLQIYTSSVTQRAWSQGREDFLRQTSILQETFSKFGLVRPRITEFSLSFMICTKKNLHVAGPWQETVEVLGVLKLLKIQLKILFVNGVRSLALTKKNKKNSICNLSQLKTQNVITNKAMTTATDPFFLTC